MREFSFPFLRASVRGGLLAVALLAMPVASQAVVVLANGDISALEVNGGFYDVAWQFGSSNPGPGDFALFDGNQTFADDFMDAVLAAFVQAGFDGLPGQQFYGVDFAPIEGAIVQDLGPFFTRITASHGPWGGTAEAGWGVVTARAAVPEPATLALAGIALLGGVAARRRPRA